MAVLRRPSSLDTDRDMVERYAGALLLAELVRDIRMLRLAWSKSDG